MQAQVLQSILKTILKLWVGGDRKNELVDTSDGNYFFPKDGRRLP